MGQSLLHLNFPYSWSSVGTPAIGYLSELIDPIAFALKYPNTVYLVHERAAYVGSIALILAAISIIRAVHIRSRRPEYWALLFLCVAGLWVGFASAIPLDAFHFLKDHIPWYQSLRVPTRHFFWFVFAGAALSGFGMQLFKPKVIRILFITLLLFQLIPIAHSQLYVVPTANTREDGELIAYLHEGSGLSRFLSATYSTDFLKYALDVNAASEHHLYSPYGYMPPPLKNYVDFILAANRIPASMEYYYFDAMLPYENFSSRYTNALNVKYIIVPIWADTLANDPRGRFVPVKENPAIGWRVYENMDVLPRFYMVGTFQIFPDRASVTEAIGQERFDPAGTVLFARTDIHGDIRQSDCPSSELSGVDVISYEAADITLRTHNQCGGYLASSEVYYPGWDAYIDGVKTTTLEGNLAFRTVYVPAGTHVIRFRYVPYMLYAGTIVSIITVAFCGFCLWRSKRGD